MTGGESPHISPGSGRAPLIPRRFRAWPRTGRHAPITVALISRVGSALQEVVNLGPKSLDPIDSVSTITWLESPRDPHTPARCYNWAFQASSQLVDFMKPLLARPA